MLEYSRYSGPMPDVFSLRISSPSANSRLESQIILQLGVEFAMVATYTIVDSRIGNHRDLRH